WGGGGAAFAAPKGGFTKEELKPLMASLEADGVARSRLEKTFFDPRLRKLHRIVEMNVVNRDPSAHYRQFSQPDALRRARRFMAQNKKWLDQAEAAYPVPRETLVAVLLVETQFGKFPQRHRPLEVFTTLTVEALNESVDAHYRKLKRKNPKLERSYVEDRMTRKARWAYGELQALMRMEPRTGGKLYDLKGSYAGALGMPQFLPSSYLIWGVDGDGNGKVELNKHADAVLSVANYLFLHGWTEDASDEAKRHAVWQYNHSDNYVNAILTVSAKLAPPPATPEKPPAEQKIALSALPVGPVSSGKPGDVVPPRVVSPSLPH
ncbi:MAG: lytic murein transglycosylase, partial [Deltaproteobacteria bacterium]|nr:lytic murein transglycosylase [Deltaproteobacteria bacterium]